MINTLLVTRPNHDPTTNHLFHWSSLVIKEASKKNINTFDLSGKKANKKNFTSYINKNQPHLIFLNGHGAEDKITGFNNETLIALGENETILSGKVVYARSCKAAKRLGPNCVKNGTLAFIGYKHDFVFQYSLTRITRPLTDQIAKLFLEPSNLVIIALLKGNNVKSSYQRSQKAMYKNLSFTLSSKATPTERYSAPFLWRNIKSQVLIQ